MIDECVKKKRINIQDLLEHWEETIRRIEDNVKEKYGAEVAQIGDKNHVKEFNCKVCAKKFAKAQALGGHMSKMHSIQKSGSQKKTSNVVNKSCRSKAVRKSKLPLIVAFDKSRVNEEEND